MLTQAERLRLAQLHRMHRSGKMNLLTSDMRQIGVALHMLMEECTDEMLEQWRIELGDRTMCKLQRMAADVIEYAALKAKHRAA